MNKISKNAVNNKSEKEIITIEILFENTESTTISMKDIESLTF